MLMIYELVTFEPGTETEEYSDHYTTIELANAALVKRVKAGEKENDMQIHPLGVYTE